MKRFLLLFCAGLVSCGLERKAEKMAKELEGTSRDYLYSVVGTIMFSPSGKLVYVAKKGEGQVVVVDGTEGPLYDRITYIAFVPAYAYPGASSASISSDLTRASSDVRGPAGERLIYVAEKDGKKLMVDDGKPGKEYDDISDINIIPEGRVLYKAKLKGKFSLVVDTAEGKFYDEIGRITYNLEHIAYWATEGDSSFVVLDGVEGPKYDKLPPGILK
ncbi:MAG: hypothetical protein ABIM46_01190 [candidate division WOR-3 bacterium]